MSGPGQNELREPAAEAQRRLHAVFSFLQALNHHRSPAKRRLAEQPWHLYLSPLPDHPTVTLTSASSKLSAEDEESGGDGEPEPLFRVSRPTLTSPPAPPAALAEWVSSGWDDPSQEARPRPSRNTIGDQGETITVAFEDDSERVELFTRWTAERDRWRVAERPARAAMSLFEKFYELHGRLGREEEHLELLIGDGLLRWQQPDRAIHHPLLLQRVELRFNPSVPEFLLFNAESDVELYSDMFHSISEVDGRTLSRCREELKEGRYHPLGSDETSGFLERLILRLSPHGRIIDDESLASSTASHPEVSRRPSLFLRKRTLGVATAIEQALSHLASSSDFPDPLLNIVGVETARSEPGEASGEAAESGAIVEPEDTLLSLPANPEQVRIAQQLDRQGGVLVQGPPGTGKTHTIANLIGHLLAQGKTILVTSHTTKALRVLRDKVAADLQPLCVSVLESDLDSRRQLEGSITAIVERLSRSNSHQLARQATTLTDERRTLLAKARSLARQITDARADEYRPVVVAGEPIDPASAARQVARQETSDGWIPGLLEAGAPLPVSQEEVISLYSTNRSISREDEHELDGTLPQLSDYPTPAKFAEMIQDLGTLADQPRNTRPDLWSRPLSSNDAPGLTEIHEGAKKAVEGLPLGEPWKLEIVQAGMLGGPNRKPWETLLTDIAAAVQKAADNQETTLRFAPEPSSSIPLAEQESVLEQILEYLTRAKRLSWFSLLVKPRWKRLVTSSLVNDERPTAREHFSALLCEARRRRARAELSRRWDRQVGTADGPSSDSLGAHLERVWAQYAPTMERLLNWHDSEWRPLVQQLADLGFQWSTFLSEQPPQAGSAGELHRLVATVNHSLGDILGSKLVDIRLSEIEDCIQDSADRLQIHSNRHGGLPPAASALLEAIRSHSSQSYEAAVERLAQIWSRNTALQTRRKLLAKIEAVASGWATAVRDRIPPHNGHIPPGDARAAWEFQQIKQELLRRNRTDLAQLQQDLDATRNRVREVTTRLIECRAWESQMRRTSLPQRQALVGWLDTVRKIGKGYGKRVTRLRTEAREKMAACRSAVPVWVMPFSRVVESFDPGSTRFDVVIIDEASQSDITSLFALLLARTVVVVGDHEQVSPPAVGQDQLVVQGLIDEHLKGVPNSDLYDGRTSIYDLARQSFGEATCLIEHFRCVPDIIGFSNGLCYDWKIKPLREISGARVKPHLIPYRVVSTGVTANVNREEAWATVSLLVAATEQPEYSGMTFGVISMVGDNQAIEIDGLLQRHLAPEEYEGRRIRCGNAAQFQGDERDVMFLSMFNVPTGDPLPMNQRPDFKQRLNVAASRAKDQLWVVHSLDPKTDLKPGDLRRRFLDYVTDPSAAQQNVEAALRRAESGFEKGVLRKLAARGFRVHSQWPVGHYRIDIVVEGEEARLAIECDGDRYHPIEKLPEDMARQAILERLGWKFERVRGSAFLMDQDSALEPVYQRLGELGIEPQSVREEPRPAPDSASCELQERTLRRAAELRRQWEEEERALETDDRADAGSCPVPDSMSTAPGPGDTTLD